MLFTCSALLFFVLEEVTYFTRHCCVCEHLSNGEDDILSKKLYWLKRYYCTEVAEGISHVKIVGMSEVFSSC